MMIYRFKMRRATVTLRQ